MKSLRAFRMPATDRSRWSGGPIVMAFLLTLILLPAALPLSAQYIWSGRTEVELTIKADKGGALEGAEVTFRFLEVRPADGPISVVTNSNGEARLFGLAEGRWHVEVVADGYRSFLASVRIRTGKKVEILSSAVLSEDGSNQAMKVHFDKARKGESGATMPPATLPPPPAPKPDRERAPEPPSTPVEKPAPEPEPAVIPDVPAVPAPEAPPPTIPTEEPMPTPIDEPDREVKPEPEPPETAVSSEPTVPEPASELPPAPEPSVEVESVPDVPEIEERPEKASKPAAPSISESPSPSPTVVAPEPKVSEANVPVEPSRVGAEAAEIVPESPAPEPVALPPAAPAAVEVPAPTPPVASPPPPLAQVPKQAMRARSGRGCPDCRAQEQAATVTATVAASRQVLPCPDDLDAKVREALDIAAKQGVGSFFGPLVDEATRDLVSELETSSRAEVGRLLQDVSGTDASCRVLAVVLPRTFRYSGYRYEAKDISGSGDCSPTDACRIGQCSWHGNPRIVRRGELQVIYGVFTNRSPDRVRHPALTVYFER